MADTFGTKKKKQTYVNVYLREIDFTGICQPEVATPKQGWISFLNVEMERGIM